MNYMVKDRKTKYVILFRDNEIEKFLSDFHLTEEVPFDGDVKSWIQTLKMLDSMIQTPLKTRKDGKYISDYELAMQLREYLSASHV